MKFSISATIRMAEFLEPDVYEVAGNLKVGRMSWTIERANRRVAVLAAFRALSKCEGRMLLLRLKEISEMKGVNVKNIVVAVENECVSLATQALGAMPSASPDQSGRLTQLEGFAGRTGHSVH
jgi:hypothetical protein